MKVTVFGTGYVGLVQAAVLAEVGHEVVCVDIDQNKIDHLKKGIIPIYEPGLESLVVENSQAGRLKFTTYAREGVEHGVVQFIAVGTPPDEDGSADLKYVLNVAETIASYMTHDVVVVNKSTVPVGTAEKVHKAIDSVLEQRKIEKPYFDVVSNPEFLKEGSAVADCMRPDRIVIGTNSQKTLDLMREIYAPFNRNHEKILVMDVRSAELTKYAANCMLATKISFMNEMANIAEKVGADIEMVRQGIGSDPRIGYHFIYAGAGYGGSCFPKDVQALIRSADEVELDAILLKSVERRNELQKTLLVEKIQRRFGENLEGLVFAVWGLSFKPNTDDMRDAPSRAIIEALWRAGASIRAYDPEAMKEAERIYGRRDDFTLCDTKESAVVGSDALVIITDWPQFKAPDFECIVKELRVPIIFDGRNLYEPARVRKKGIEYVTIGRL